MIDLLYFLLSLNFAVQLLCSGIGLIYCHSIPSLKTLCGTALVALSVTVVSLIFRLPEKLIKK